MKNIKILMIILCFGIFGKIQAQKYYDEQWKKVAGNSQKGIYKSNIPIILDIQKQAMKDNNIVQLILSLRSEFAGINHSYDDTRNDNASSFFIKLKKIGAELKGQDKIAYDVFESLFIKDFYQNNLWEINQRTNMSSLDLSQMETWTKLDFKNYLLKTYKDLDGEKAIMTSIPLDKYKKLFSGKEDLRYTPTLFDWYSSEKLTFYSDSDLFTKNELKENRTQIEQIYNELIAGNSGNAKLYFMKEKEGDICFYEKCKDRIERYKTLLKSNTEGDYKVVIMMEIMSLLQDEKKNNEVLELVNDAKIKYPKSPFLKNVLQMEEEIKNPSIEIKYEDDTQSNKPIHIVVNHKNVKNCVLNIYQIKDNFDSYMLASRNNSGNDLSKVSKNLVRKESFNLPDLKDFLPHSTALEIKPLPAGIYVAEFTLENTNLSKNFFFIVSDNKIIYQKKNEKNDILSELKLVNSENGKPVTNENLVVYEYADGKSLPLKTFAQTNSQGVFVLSKSANGEIFKRFLIHQPKTNSFQKMNVYGKYNYSENEGNLSVASQIFTDRAAYRPGQTVYFKVINTKIANKIESVANNLKQKIIMQDPNGEEISSQDFVSNEFGSYHGSFILPKGKMNGRFALVTNGGAYGLKTILVEEYKRPKFEVNFEPVKNEYKYGQAIEIKGRAVSYSGVALNNTTVNYEIKKQNIRWKYFSWFPEDRGSENSILGEVKTNEKGEFTIDLNLEKDENKEGIQIDEYSVNASVTDINGETQSSETSLKVASVSYYIKADAIDNAFADENIKVNVETKNYNDQKVDKSYKVKLSKLKSQGRIFRDNFKSDVQDLPQFTKEEFIAKFPHDRFDKSEGKKNRGIEKIIISKTNKSSENLDLGRLEAGDYELELFDIQDKDTIKTSQYFSIWDKNSLKPDQKVFLTVLDPKIQYRKGEKAKIYAYSAIPDAFVNVFVQDGSGNTVSETHQFKNGVLEYVVNIPNDDNWSRTDVQFQVVAFNDVQTQTILLNKKPDAEPLKIETITFRDKIQPNSKEKWSIKVLGSEKEQINAEVLANMYDVSLDKISRNIFLWNKLYRSYYNFTSYSLERYISSETAFKSLEYLPGIFIRAPYFTWFQYELSPYQEYMEPSGGLVQGRAAPAPMAYKVAKYESAPTLQSLRIDDEAINILNSGRQLSVEEKMQFMSDENGAGMKEMLNNVPIRQNLNETAFFYPDLKTDSEGNVSFEFTSPEALTKWKLMFLAHTKDARAATLEKEVVTQKEFSVTPNYPRFLREGDELNLQSKLSNLTSKKLNGSASLQILDAFTNEDISSQFGLNSSIQNFDLNENGNSALTWKIKVPNNVSSIILKVVAKAGQYSDGEQKAVAVLPNRMLVTDVLPIFVKEGETKTFELENLKNATSTTISNVSNTLELTTNPIWEIMFALPSLKNDQNNSADVIFNKWFADVLASEIFKANPKMKAIFEEYQNKGLLDSNLEKNQELKQLLLEETPWVLESKNEQEQMQKLALLFDANSMKNSINQDWDDFKKLQNPDGGFSWYQGYPSSYSTSLYILKNLGKINSWLKENVKDYQSSEQKELVENLTKYVDNEIAKYWDVKKENVWSNWAIDYLDTRNYWEKQYPLKGKGATLKSLIKQKAKTAKITEFTFFGLHRAALLMNDYGLKDVSDKLMTYLKETSVDSKTQGAYWKQNLDDWGWFSSKVVNHAGALEAFNKLKPNDQKFIEDMKIWLITQKEVNSWGSSRGTSEVIFTILNSGKSWTTADSDKATIIWGGKELKPETQATGYVKSSVKTDVLDKNLATVTVTKPGAGIVQGGLFWQYYEDLDKIKSSENYISITKELYKKIKTVNGEELQKISPETPLKVGDKVTVRMILNTDRAMEFIHIKDMRAAGFEPVDVLSGYQWKNNLGYYQSTKDASTNFYIEHMPKGKYVFEYDYVANASGKFSNGITTIQNYYAPQMNAHTKGTNVQILE